MEKGKCGYLGCISVWFGFLRGPLASQMIDLGCQDTDWLGGLKRDVLDTILLWNGLILAPAGMDKEKCGCLLVGWAPLRGP